MGFDFYLFTFSFLKIFFSVGSEIAKQRCERNGEGG